MAQAAHPSSRPLWWRIGLPLLVLSVLLAGMAWFVRPDRNLRVIFLDTPGDAALIQTPRGSYVLIDGGRKPAGLAMHLGRQLPFWQRRLAAVVLTHNDRQRLPGQVAALARYRADLVLAPPGMEQTALVQEWLRLIDSQRMPLHLAQAGDQLQLDGALLTVLSTGNGQESGLVLQLDYGLLRVVFHSAGGTTSDQALIEHAGPITALAYPWQREVDTPLLARWQPQMIIFTTAYEADRPAELSMYERALYGAAVYHPQLHGTVELISDGQRAWVVTEK